jgi:hypothetical protein
MRLCSRAELATRGFAISLITGECRFGRLLLNSFLAHSPHDVTGANRLQVNLDQAPPPGVV